MNQKFDTYNGNRFHKKKVKSGKIVNVAGLV
jgi:hypothetical protein